MWALVAAASVVVLALFWWAAAAMREGLRKSQEPITAVMLTYNRPANLTQTLPPLLAAPAIARIVISHGKSATLPQVRRVLAAFDDERVVLYDDAGLNDAEGLARRYIRGAEAPTRLVLLLDDDIVLSEALLEKMVASVDRPGQLPFVGPFGRSCNAAGYDDKAPAGKADTVLPGAALVSRELARLYLANKHIVEDGISAKATRWNGEDLCFNFVVRTLTGQTPRRVRGAYSWVNRKTADAFHVQPGHYAERDLLCRELASLG